VVAGEPISCVIKVSPKPVEEGIENYLPARKGMTFVFPQSNDPSYLMKMYERVRRIDETGFWSREWEFRRAFEENSVVKEALKGYDLEEWIKMANMAGIVAYIAMNRVAKKKELAQRSLWRIE